MEHGRRWQPMHHAQGVGIISVYDEGMMFGFTTPGGSDCIIKSFPEIGQCEYIVSEVRQSGEQRGDKSTYGSVEVANGAQWPVLSFPSPRC